jgi:hypothetical protein
MFKVREENLQYRYPAGYRICLSGYMVGYRILKITGYPAKLKT